MLVYGKNFIVLNNSLNLQAKFISQKIKLLLKLCVTPAPLHIILLGRGVVGRWAV